MRKDVKWTFVSPAGDFQADGQRTGAYLLGGEELKRCCKENFYEIKKVKIEDLDDVDILAKDMIMKAYNNEFIELQYDFQGEYVMKDNERFNIEEEYLLKVQKRIEEEKVYQNKEFEEIPNKYKGRYAEVKWGDEDLVKHFTGYDY